MNFFTIKKQDWILNGSILFLAIASLLSLASSRQPLFLQQLVWYVLGIGAMYVVAQLDWRPLINYPRLIHSLYLGSILLLGATYLFAPRIRGIKGWLVLGPWQFQTSEVAKLALIIILSSFWAKAHIQIARLGNVARSLVYFVIPTFLVLLQPDMGTALILFGIWFGYLLVSGIKWKHLLAAGGLFVITGFILWLYALAPYQKDRIIGLFYPERDPLGINYNVIQSKIAIGSADWFGKGFGQGTQVRLGFLPEPETDFIFSAFVEEWGLTGGLLVVAAFILVLIRISIAGLQSDNNFSRMFCLGIVMMFLLHFLINIGSALGFLPVIGIPFPFLSYGGSNLLTSLVAIGIIQGIIVRSQF